jgi:asparagine synthase (glutamine-hydrolysing)
VVTDSSANPDYVHAVRIASSLGIQLNCTEFSYEQYIDSLPNAVWIEEQPGAFSAAPFQFLAQSVAAHSKIVISGEGADELFGGYSDYVESPLRARERLAKALRLERAGLAPRPETIRSAERESRVSSAAQYAEEMLERVFWGRLQANHLELADRHFMAYGVECRVPYLDELLVSYVASLPLWCRVDGTTGIQKVALRCLLAGEGALSAYCSLRRKQGLPAAAWRHSRRLAAELERYAPQCNVDLASRMGLLGVRAFSWDLFHEIFVSGKGVRPNPHLANQLALAQGISLGGDSR